MRRAAGSGPLPETALRRAPCRTSLKGWVRVREIDAKQRAWRRLGPINVNATDIRRAEADTFYGLSLRPEADDGPDPGAHIPPVEGGFLSEAISPVRRQV